MAYGCGGSTSEFVGKWEGEIAAEAPPGTHPAVEKTAKTLHLEIKEDGTFVLTEMGLSFTGNVFSASGGAQLKVTQFMERPVANTELVRRAELKLRRDGKGQVTVEEPMGLQTDPVVLQRSK